eukprot:GCRY01003834.1.p1 GENE.GCRY01003834.1~~GCRY01003834.1.p1  ORF type:complete len:457 (+),score=47.92 GCRY01003834.1:123-1373(+)
MEIPLSKRSVQEKEFLLALGPIKVAQNPYHKTKNPSGCISCGVAENSMMWDLLEPKLRECQQNFDLNTTRYDASHGRRHFREALANNLAEFVPNTSSDGISVVSSAISILEILFFCLCEEGDSVLIPAPYYGAFSFCLQARIGVNIDRLELDPEDNWQLTPALLDNKIKSSIEKGIKLKAFLLTSPNNPFGEVYSKEELEQFVKICEKYRIHLVSDEIYCRSVHKGEFVSVLGANVSESFLPYVHIIYGFAKDYGLSGVYTGLLYTHNRDLTNRVNSYASFSSVSNFTQDMLCKLIEDKQFHDEYFTLYRQRLQDRYERVISLLKSYSIKHYPAAAGFFVMLDLRKELGIESIDDEIACFKELLDDAGLYITPGSFFENLKPGYFRFCFGGSLDCSEVELALKRLNDYVRKKKASL